MPNALVGILDLTRLDLTRLDLTLWDPARPSASFDDAYAMHTICAETAPACQPRRTPTSCTPTSCTHTESTLSATEEQILLGVARGDEPSVVACIETFGPLVQSITRTVLADRALADDACAEVFARLWASAPRFDPAKGSAKAWVCVLARRTLIDMGRKEQSRANTRAGWAAEVRAKGTSAQMSRDASAPNLDDDLASARRALALLPATDREALELSAARGWSHARISAHMALPLGTIKTMIRRSLVRVRDSLSGAGAARQQGVTP